MRENVQAAAGEQLDCKRYVAGFRFILRKQFRVQIFERRRVSAVIHHVTAVYVCHTTVNDGFALCAQLARADELFTKAHDKLGFQEHRVFAVTIVAGHVHCVNVVLASCGKVDDLTTQRTDKGRVLSLRVYYNNIVICTERDGHDFFLCGKALA